MYDQKKIDELNAARLDAVKPELAEKCRALIELAKAEKYTLVVTQGYRSFVEQTALYAKGRRGIKGERKVTNARAGQSNHNFKTAVDFAFVVVGEISWDEKLYQNIGRWAQKVGLKWGGKWRTLKDLPHVEL